MMRLCDENIRPLLIELLLDRSLQAKTLTVHPLIIEAMDKAIKRVMPTVATVDGIKIMSCEFMPEDRMVVCNGRRQIIQVINIGSSTEERK